jgi:predicted RNA-binding Zn-ribbon protein involved in translation (DUF1610 family)
MSGMTIYIAGPMTGLPESNYPAFHDAELALRAKFPGAWVINPASNFKGRRGLAWGHYMRESLRQLAEATDLVRLPGWHLSKGARLECRIAADLEITIWEGHDLGLAPKVCPDCGGTGVLRYAAGREMACAKCGENGKSNGGAKV